MTIHLFSVSNFDANLFGFANYSLCKFLNFQAFIYINRFVHVLFGLSIFIGNCASIYYWDKELITFFVKMFKSKSV